jgi:hypothetical protein
MARIYDQTTPTQPENSSKYPNNAVVVATEEGLARLPARVRKQLVNRWGIVHGIRANSKEVMVYYSAFDSETVRNTMLVPYSVDGTTLKLVAEDEKLAAWRQRIAAYQAKQDRRVWPSRSR